MDMEKQRRRFTKNSAAHTLWAEVTKSVTPVPHSMLRMETTTSATETTQAMTMWPGQLETANPGGRRNWR